MAPLSSAGAGEADVRACGNFTAINPLRPDRPLGYAWSHYHLCIKRGGDPYQTPLTISTTHPADDARMRALIRMLRKADAFRKHADLIEHAWKEFCEIMGPSAEYRQCYSERLLSSVIDAASRGIKGIGLTAAAENPEAPVVTLLNEAWSAFWSDPGGYQKWKAKRVRELRDSLRV